MRPRHVDSFPNVFCVARLPENTTKPLVFQYFLFFIFFRSDAPRRPQDAPSRPKIPHDVPKTPTRRLQDHPTTPPRRPQDGPRTPPRRPKTPQDAPRCLKTPQDGPETPPRRPQDAPRRPQDACISHLLVSVRPQQPVAELSSVLLVVSSHCLCNDPLYQWIRWFYQSIVCRSISENASGGTGRRPLQ